MTPEQRERLEKIQWYVGLFQKDPPDSPIYDFYAARYFRDCEFLLNLCSELRQELQLWESGVKKK